MRRFRIVLAMMMALMATGGIPAAGAQAFPAADAAYHALLVAPDRLPGQTAAQLDRIRPARLAVLGGLAAIRDEVAAAAALAAR